MTAADEVATAARSRAAALAAGDELALTALLHPDLRWTTHTGLVLDRASYVGRSTAAGHADRTRWLSQDLGDPTVVVVGDTAVLLTTVTDTVETAAGPEVFQMPMTQCWVRAGDGWVLLAGHAGPRLGDRPD